MTIPIEKLHNDAYGVYERQPMLHFLAKIRCHCEKLHILSKSRCKVDLILVVYNVDLILVVYTTKIKSTLCRLLLKIFSFSTGNYADQIKPLIQRTPTGRLSTVACFKALPLWDHCTPILFSVSYEASITRLTLLPAHEGVLDQIYFFS